MKVRDTDPREAREAIEAELCRRSFVRFARRAWREIEPNPIVWNWHIDAICLHLQAVAEGKIRNLLINIGPGYAKSILVSVLWPAWRWARQPWWRVLGASHAEKLSIRDATKARTLIQSAWYQKHFTIDPRDPSRQERWQLQVDQNVKTYYANTALGFRQALSVTGGGTGYRGDTHIYDDLLDASDARSSSAKLTARRWLTETMTSRFNKQATGEKVAIMQRLADDDPSDLMLRSREYVHLRVPSEYEPPNKCPVKECVTCHRDGGRTPIIDPATGERWKDPRTKEGEPAFPALFGADVLARDKDPHAGMGPIAFAGQHQQRPVPESGGLIKREWLGKRWHYPGSSNESAGLEIIGLERRPYNPRTSKSNRRFIVTDAAFKKLEDNDKVAIGVFDVVGPDLYLIDFKWDHMGLTDTIQAIVDLRAKWNATAFKVGNTLVEDKANGSAVIEVLRKKIPGILEIEPLGSKEARVASAADFMHSGNVWLPEAHHLVSDAVEEATSFPRARRDDWIDMVSYGVLIAFLGSDLSTLEGLAKW